MKLERLPSRWASAQPALRAVQLAFDVSESVFAAVRQAAFHAGLSNSDQIRVVLGLPMARQAKRPRLTVSLSPDDYILLAKRYRLAADDHLQIKEKVAEELASFASGSRASGTAVRSPRKPASRPPSNDQS